jgi:hypothetical protein
LYQGAWSTAISHGVLLLSTLAKSACKHKIVEKMGKEFFKKKMGWYMERRVSSTARRYTKKCQRKPNWIYHPNSSSKETGLADTHEIAQTSEHRETDQEREREMVSSLEAICTGRNPHQNQHMRPT